MNDILVFSERAEFRNWLSENCLSTDGVWLLFGKHGNPKTIKADEALEEALCFGWIDGQMQSIDNNTYKKYFSMRRANCKWSEKNKTLVKVLEERGLMTDFGRKKIEEAKQAYEPAYTNFSAMSISVKKTYVKAYLDAKTDTGREKRIAWMVERLNKNLKPM